MARTLPPIVELADQLAHTLGGTAHILDTGAYPSAAIAFDGWHRLLLRDHQGSLTLSLPVEVSWQVQTPEELVAIEPAIRTALAGPPLLAMSEVITAFAPVVARTTERPWTVSFPGTPVPQEAWLKDGDRSVGLFQTAGGVRVVIHADAMLSRSFTAPAAFAAAEAWLEDSLRRQGAAQAAAAAEAARKAALPVPDYDEVLAVLKSGARIQTSGARYHETFFWDGQLRRDVFDEGERYILDGTEADLRRHIASYPDAFRAALAR